MAPGRSRAGFRASYHGLHLEVDEDELTRRRAAWSPPEPAMRSGYQKLYVDHVLQASEGADLDFLRGCRGAAIPRASH